jgi:glycogen debranching enzyme
MIKAIDYLHSRDIDNDGILEQSHNEDWMDTGLRAGKVVYSQACFILGLNNLSYLLAEIGQDEESKKMMKMSNKTINAVEKILWSEDKGAHTDILKSDHIGGPYRVLTQDVSLYLVAISENTNSDSLRIHQNNNNNSSSDIPNQESNTNKGNNIHKKGNDNSKEHPLKQKYGKHDNQQQQQQQDKEGNQQRFEYDDSYNNLDLLLQRSNKTLDSIKEKVWLDKWPTNIETLLKESGPLHLKPYFYHNRTFWPWITGIEMTARSRFDRFNECNTLLSKLASEEDIHISTFYEWVNPKTGKGGGAYPFRTGVCTVRTGIDHIIKGLDDNKRKDILK